VQIGEVATVSGVPVKTIRYYEEIGVLEAPRRTASGYRDYSLDVLDQLAFIRSSQSVGLSLAQIREILKVRAEGVVPCQYVLSLLIERERDYRRKIAELIKARESVAALIERAQSLEPQACLPDNICHLIPV